jgi:hypothetical protein
VNMVVLHTIQSYPVVAFVVIIARKVFKQEVIMPKTKLYFGVVVRRFSLFTDTAKPPVED